MNKSPVNESPLNEKDQVPVDGPSCLSCSSCDHWDCNVKHDGLPFEGACGYLHKVELYGKVMYLSLLTEGEFSCPNWGAKKDWEPTELPPKATGEAEDDPPDTWDESEKQEFANSVVRLRGREALGG